MPTRVPAAPFGTHCSCLCVQVDVLYVHNPAEAQLVALGRTAFMERLKAAFVALEAMRQEGLLGVYGLATWDCFRVPSTSKLVSEADCTLHAAIPSIAPHTCATAPFKCALKYCFVHGLLWSEASSIN